MNPTDPDTEILSIRVTKALKEQMESLAQARGQDQSQLAEQALSEYVAFEAEQLAKIPRGVREADAGDFATDEEMEILAVMHQSRRWPERF